MQAAIVEQEDMRKPCDQGLCLKQPPLAVHWCLSALQEPCCRHAVILRRTAGFLGGAPTHAQVHTRYAPQRVENRTSPLLVVTVDFLCVLAERNAK